MQEFDEFYDELVGEVNPLIEIEGEITIPESVYSEKYTQLILSLRTAVDNGVITEAEFEEITGQPY